MISLIRIFQGISALKSFFHIWWFFRAMVHSTYLLGIFHKYLNNLRKKIYKVFYIGNDIIYVKFIMYVNKLLFTLIRYNLLHKFPYYFNNLHGTNVRISWTQFKKSWKWRNGKTDTSNTDTRWLTYGTFMIYIIKKLPRNLLSVSNLSFRRNLGQFQSQNLSNTVYL